jgi:hypothetical protein
MRKVILFLTLLLVAATATAGSRACTAGLVAGGVCAAPTDRLVFFSLAPATEQALVDALARQGGYEATLLCTAGRIADGHCTKEQLGSSFPNPQNERQFAQAQLARFLGRIVDRHRTEQAEDAARAGVTPVDIKP